MIEGERYAVVWQPYEGQSPSGRALPRSVSFPFLLAGEQLVALEAQKPARLDARALFEGILIAFDAPSPFADCASHAQMIDTLSDLVGTMRAVSLETLALDGCAYIREHFGLGAGQAALRTAVQVVPQSGMIKSDLLMTAWLLIREADEPVQEELLQEIATHFPGINLDLVDAQAVDTLILMYTTALTFLPPRSIDREAFVRSVAVPRVIDPKIGRLIQYLLYDPDPRLSTVL